jgi:hypothetical protein
MKKTGFAVMMGSVLNNYLKIEFFFPVTFVFFFSLKKKTVNNIALTGEANQRSSGGIEFWFVC